MRSGFAGPVVLTVAIGLFQAACAPDTSHSMYAAISSPSPMPAPTPGPIAFRGDGPNGARNRVFVLWPGTVSFVGRYAGTAPWQVDLVPMDTSLPAHRLFTSKDGDAYHGSYVVRTNSKHYIDVKGASGPWTIEFEGVESKALASPEDAAR